MKCPRCIRRLRPESTSCLCGWKAETSTVDRPSLVVDYGALERERERVRRWEDAGSPPASESISKMRALLGKPRPSPRAHWEKVLRTPNAPLLAVEYARAALGRSSDEPMESMTIEREPGCDDEQEMAA